VESTIPVRELPKELKLIPPKLEVVSDKNLNEFLANNRRRNGSVVFIAMDVREYEVSAYNFAEIDRYVKQLHSLVKYYEEQIQIRKEVEKAPE
jgi:ADP-glucose pyrophosphorylase